MSNTFQAAQILMDATTQALAQPSAYNPPEGWRDKTPVQRAEHLYSCYHAWRAAEICTQEGITDEQAAVGATNAHILKFVRKLACARFGSPEYGAWPPHVAVWISEELIVRGYTEEGK